MDCVAPMYEGFLDGVRDLEKMYNPKMRYTVEELQTDFPQYFNYEKIKQLVLWKITSTPVS